MRQDLVEAVDAARADVELATAESLRWRPVAVVEKFTADHAAYVTSRLDLRRAPSGDELARYCRPDAVAGSIGNLLTTAGLTRLTSLLTAAGGQALTNTATRLGVGNSTTAETVAQTDLQAAAGAANRQFKIMDATYPSTSAGVVTAKSTFATSDANFAWQEWGLDIGTPTVSDGTTVNATLFNRKVASLGTKTSAGTWALTVTITIS